MKLTAGTRIGPYEIESGIGAGGMGEVYLARDERLERKVAIKILPAVVSTDQDRLRRFEREARAVAALNHPNIIALDDIGTCESAPFMVTELLHGETLRQRCVRGILSVQNAVEYALQIANGLTAAHDRGVVHRDLKPENVFVTSEGRVKILDFGLAKLTDSENPVPESALPTVPVNTLPGVVLGTVGYMAPEQVRGQLTDHRTDIFALGIVLYELLAGRRAFQGETDADTLSAILKEEPVDFPSERHVSPGLARVVRRCLEKQPGMRFQAARDLAFALEGISTSSDDRFLAASRNHNTGRKRLILTAAALSLLGAAIGTRAYFFGDAPSTTAPEMRLQLTTPPDASLDTFALSPDGSSLVFQAGRQLWITPLQSDSARALPGTEGAVSGGATPFWAPDGKSVGFFTRDQLKRIDLESGLVQTLSRAPYGIGGTWNKSGTILFSPGGYSPITRVGSGGRDAIAATTLQPGQVGHRFPQFLPDGRHFIFLVLGTADQRGLYLGSLDTPDTRRLLQTDTQAVFAPPDLLLFSESGSWHSG